jgi:nucleotide-binding universal stress UspA family protein
MKIIKNILLLTDFSANDLGAFRYAKSLTDNLDARFIVLHIHPKYYTPKDEIQLQETISTFINYSKTEGLTTVNTNETIHILRGETLFQIIEMVQSKDVDMIVMSTQKMRAFVAQGKTLPSLMDLLKKGFCPILIVPPNTKWSPIENVLIASKINLITPNIVQHMAYFAQLLETVIHFTHVSEGDADNYTTIKHWSEIYQKANVQFRHEVYSVGGETKMARLKRYMHKKDIDIVAFFNNKCRSWHELFNSNIYEKLTISNRIPILLFNNFKVKRMNLSNQIEELMIDYRMEGQSFFF